MTLVLPELVRAIDSDLLLPTCTLPKLTLDGLAVNAPALTPVPESGRLSVGFDALLVIAMFPLAFPLAEGVKPTLKVALCPAVSVKGRVSPLRLKPLPVAVACEMVTLVPPLLVSVPVLVWLVPV